MIKIQLHLTELQEKKLSQIKKDTGTPKAELIRRALDQYLNNNEQKRGDFINDNY